MKKRISHLIVVSLLVLLGLFERSYGDETQDLLRGRFIKENYLPQPGDILFLYLEFPRRNWMIFGHTAILCPGWLNPQDYYAYEMGADTSVSRYSRSISNQELGHLIQSHGNIVYQFTSKEFGERLCNLMEKRVEDHPPYSIQKGMKSIFARKYSEMDDSEKIQLIEKLIKKKIYDQRPGFYSTPRERSASKDSRGEICSTLIGNAIQLIALESNAESSYVFRQMAQDLQTQVSRTKEADMQRLIHEAATQLRFDNEFRGYSHIDDSSVFAVNPNRMMPRDLLRFLNRMNDNHNYPPIPEN